MPKTASLLPSDHTRGFNIPDGDYIIKTVQTMLHDYGGNSLVDVPAIAVLYADPKDPATTYEWRYKAGDVEHLIPTENGKSFQHPNGKDEARLYGAGAASLWLKSLADSGFPMDKVSDDVTVFQGANVHLVNKAAPKGKTGEQTQDKSFPIVTKINSLPSASGKPAKAQIPAAESNGDAVDDKAIEAVQAALAAAEGNKRTRIKLATDVFISLTKQKDPAAAAVKKLVGDATWLAANAEVGGWSSDGESVVLG